MYNIDHNIVHLVFSQKSRRQSLLLLLPLEHAVMIVMMTELCIIIIIIDNGFLHWLNVIYSQDVEAENYLKHI